MLRTRVCLALVALVGVAFVAAAAGRGQGAADRAETLTYRDLSGYRDAVAFAIRSWNVAGAGVRFVPAATGRKPDFTIRRLPVVRADDGEEVAGRGGPGFGVVLSRKVLGDPRWFTQAQTIVAAHELGHVLGLPHSKDPCSVMNQSVDGSEFACFRARSGVIGDGVFRCGPSRADAAAVARRRRRPNPPVAAQLGFCRVPAGLFAATYEPSRLEGESETVTVTVRNTGKNAWHGSSVFLELIHTDGDALGDVKLVAPYEENEAIVPGGAATFGVGLVHVCPGTEIVFRARLLEASFNVYIGATETIRVTTPAPPFPVPCRNP